MAEQNWVGPHPLDRCKNCFGFRSEHSGPDPMDILECLRSLNCVGFELVGSTFMEDLLRKESQQKNDAGPYRCTTCKDKRVVCGKSGLPWGSCSCFWCSSGPSFMRVCPDCSPDSKITICQPSQR